jgi:hypothetical protein
MGQLTATTQRKYNFQILKRLQNSLTQPPEHHQYDISYPPLSKQNEIPWTKEKYKKRPRDTPENHMKTTKRPTLNDYWLNQPPPSNNNKFTVLMDVGMEEEQTSTQHTTPNLCGGGSKHTTAKRTPRNNRGRRI